jgi:hypothetical protein
MLFSIEAVNRKVSCWTRLTARRRDASVTARTSWPSIVIRPALTS